MDEDGPPGSSMVVKKQHGLKRKLINSKVQMYPSKGMLARTESTIREDDVVEYHNLLQWHVRGTLFYLFDLLNSWFGVIYHFDMQLSDTKSDVLVAWTIILVTKIHHTSDTWSGTTCHIISLIHICLG